MPIQGFTRLRKHLFGRQAEFGTKVASTRAYPFRGTPTPDLNWTDPEIDTGSLDLVAAPYPGAPDLTAPLDAPSLDYNSLPILHSAFFGGAVDPTGGGTAQTWTYEPASLTAEEFDPYSYEFGDDVLPDWYQFGDGVLESWEVTGPEGLGVLTVSASWRFGSVSSTGSTDYPVSGTVPTPDLVVDPNAALVFLKDCAIYIASDPDDLSTSQIEDALHTFALRFSQELDQKRFANGDQSFDIDAYGRGARTIELECTFAKTDDTVGTGSESDAWMSDAAVTRYVRLVFTSTVVAEEGAPDVFYSWAVTMPMRYYTREEGEIGGNTTIVLTGKAFFDPIDFEKVFQSIIVNTLTAEDLGTVGS
jgi:hypothetical protein